MLRTHIFETSVRHLFVPNLFVYVLSMIFPLIEFEYGLSKLGRIVYTNRCQVELGLARTRRNVFDELESTLEHDNPIKE